MAAGKTVGWGFDEFLAPGDAKDEDVAEAAHAQAQQGQKDQREDIQEGQHGFSSFRVALSVSPFGEPPLPEGEAGCARKNGLDSLAPPLGELSAQPTERAQAAVPERPGNRIDLEPFPAQEQGNGTYPFISSHRRRQRDRKHHSCLPRWGRWHGEAVTEREKQGV